MSAVEAQANAHNHPAQTGVTLQPGDNFQQANDSHPAGTLFHIASGVHRQQRVVNPKKGNQWIGTKDAILDGEAALSDAFSGRAEQVTLRNLTLRNYIDNGINFRTGNTLIIDQVHITDTGSGNGESNGAMRFFNIQDLVVTHCTLTRVSSGILPTECTGPIRLEHNTGINTGRNFVQLDKCTGGGIRIRYNSMERSGTYLRPQAQDVEDWISVYKVRGLPNDPAQFNYNRARGHGTSGSGSFIMLGDGGGIYQQAVGNIGVTPGQVGIGLSGGEHIEVRANRLFSAVWAESNIAFYSSNYAKDHPCGHHVLKDNQAHWLNRDGRQNTFWTNDTCTPLTVQDNHFPNDSLSEQLWDQWEDQIINLLPSRED